MASARQKFAEKAKQGSKEFLNSDRVKAVKTHLKVSAPDKHNVPTAAMVAITICIPLLVALTNWVMVEIDVFLVSLKFDTFETVIVEHGWLPGTLLLVGFALLFATVAALMVFFIAPICAGSGLPEAKGYLNGNHIPGMFMKRNFLVRVFGVVLATASGFPVGREGPMVCIGGCIGIAVVDVLAAPYVTEWVKLDQKSDMAALVLYERRFAAAKRVGCVLGAAAGIAVAFNAPVGAILYMFEEVTVNGWPSELTFRAFVVTAAASFFSRFLLNIIGSDVHRLLIYDEDGYDAARDWDWADIPFFVLLAACCGLASGLFSKVLAEVWSFRRHITTVLGKRSYYKIVEVMVYAALCALVFCIVPLTLGCTTSSHADSHGTVSHVLETLSSNSSVEDDHSTGTTSSGHRRLSGLDYLQFTCEAGQYNQGATLLLSTAESAVKHLFSRSSEDVSLWTLVVSFLAYGALATGMPGLSVPMGMFVPNLLLGALMGRFAGEAINSRIEEGMAHPGVYAMVGSAAMLGGFTHMTIAIVVLLLEAAQDLSIVSPLMLGVFVAHFVSKAVSHEGYDELLIIRKGVPYLDADTVKEMEATNLSALQLTRRNPLPEGTILTPHASLEDVRRALEAKDIDEFPVVDEGICIGLVSRGCLEAASDAVAGLNDSDSVERTPTVLGRIATGLSHVQDLSTSSAPRNKSIRVTSSRDRNFTVTFHEDKQQIEDSYGDLKSFRESNTHTRSAVAEMVKAEAMEARDRIRTMTCCDLDALVEMKRVETKASSLSSSSSAVVSPETFTRWPVIPLVRIMDPTPYIILEDMPLTRFYYLFTTNSNCVACVISTDGTFKGLLTRSHLIGAVNHSHSEQHRQHSPSLSENSDNDEPGPQSYDSTRINATQPRTHGLPSMTIWSITGITAIAVAFTNIGMVLLDTSIVTWKYDVMQTATTKAGMFLGALYIVGISSGLALASASFVSLVAPICAGSGIPEAKGYMNGNVVPGMFEPPNFFVRALGVVMSTAAGLPIGREGPMVCIGGIIGVATVHILGIKHVQRSVEVNQRSFNTLVVEEERFRHAKRVGCVLGAAAGIATAFAAPIGAILYMIEEVTVDTWPHELTLRTFVCTAIAVMISRAVLNVMGQDVHRLLLYDPSLTEERQWAWIDLPFFVVVAVLGGLCSVLLTKIFAFVWTKRTHRYRDWLQKGLQPHGKILEVCAYAAFCAAVFYCVPIFGSCIEEAHDTHAAVTSLSTHSSSTDDTTSSSTGHRLLSDASHSLNLVRYTCPEGSYNEVASLLLSGAEGAVKHLFAREGAETLHIGSLLLVLLTYFPLAGGMPGLPVPMGAFVPSMLTGGLLGRLVGEVVSGIDGTAHAGIYSMVGSAAMLGGFTHMTLAIVVLLVEASHDLSLVSPLMLAVVIARSISKYFCHHGYDEILILKKGVAFLDSKCPAELQDRKVCDVCDKLPLRARLPSLASDSMVKRALEDDNIVHFPVFESGVCVGVVARARLIEVIKVREEYYNATTVQKTKTVMQAVLTYRSHSDSEQCRYAGDPGGVSPGLKVGRFMTRTKSDDLIPLREIMDPAPFTVLDEMLVLRAYPMFTKAGLNAACVVSRTGEFVGVLSRANLLSTSGKAHGQEMSMQNSNSTSNESYDQEDYDEELDLDNIDLSVGGVPSHFTRRSRKSSDGETFIGRVPTSKSGGSRIVRFGTGTDTEADAEGRKSEVQTDDKDFSSTPGTNAAMASPQRRGLVSFLCGCMPWTGGAVPPASSMPSS